MRFAFLGLVCVLGASASAGPLAYVTGYQSDLQIIDLNSPATFYVKNIGFVANGLAATNSGNLYATDNMGMLWDITGPSIPIFGLGAQVGALDSDGTDLWGYDNGSDRIFKFDVGMSAVTQWSPVLGLGGSVQAMAIDSNGDFLTISQGYLNQFDRIDSNTWSIANINPNIVMPDYIMGIDFLSDGNLYATVFADHRYQINPNNGAASGFYSGVHRDFGAMTAVPVPEPSSLALVALGLAGLRRRRRG